jgi:transcriptional regulator with XRE-family HTH domain
VMTLTVGEKIKELRLERGWSQTRLGYESGLSPTTISRLETGKNPPEDRTLRDLARAFDVDERTLLGLPRTSASEGTN